MANPAARPAPRAQPKQEEDKSKTVITPIGIACFPHIFQPHAWQEGDEPNYSLLIVFEKDKVQDDPAWKQLRAGVSAALKAKFGDKAKDMLAKGKLSLPWRPAEEYEQYGEPFVEGNLFINVKSKNPPGVVNARSQAIMNQNDFYAGCLVRVSCLPWAFNTKGNTGCTLLLNNVQKAGEGERLSGRMDPEDEFGAVDGAGGDDDAEDLLG